MTFPLGSRCRQAENAQIVEMPVRDAVSRSLADTPIRRGTTGDRISLAIPRGLPTGTTAAVKPPVRSGRSMHTACYLTCGSDDCRIGRSPFANPPLAEVARRKLRLAASPDEVRPESHAREPE